MDTINRGNAAEGAVLAALVAADLPVLLPFGQGLGFDLAAAVPPRGDVIRIQVKCGRVRKGCVLFNACSTDHGRGRQPYRGRADVIAVYVRELSRVFVVPVEECPTYVGTLRLEATRNNQMAGVRFATDYTFDAWLRSLEEDPATSDRVDSCPPLWSALAAAKPSVTYSVHASRLLSPMR
jgi:hypothetical protein